MKVYEIVARERPISGQCTRLGAWTIRKLGQGFQLKEIQRMNKFHCGVGRLGVEGAKCEGGEFLGVEKEASAAS